MWLLSHDGLNFPVIVHMTIVHMVMMAYDCRDLQGTEVQSMCVQSCDKQCFARGTGCELYVNQVLVITAEMK